MALSPVGAVKLGLWNQPCVYANLSVHLRLYSRGFVIETSSFDRRERGLSQSPCRNRRVGKNKPYDAAALRFISFHFISITVRSTCLYIIMSLLREVVRPLRRAPCSSISNQPTVQFKSSQSRAAPGRVVHCHAHMRHIRGIAGVATGSNAGQSPARPDRISALASLEGSEHRPRPSEVVKFHLGLLRRSSTLLKSSAIRRILRLLQSYLDAHSAFDARRVISRVAYDADDADDADKAASSARGAAEMRVRTEGDACSGAYPRSAVLRRYTVTHSDETGVLTTSVGSEYDQVQLRSLKQRLFRDCIRGDLVKKSAAYYVLHLYAYVAGKYLIWPCPAAVRSYIFQRDINLVVESIVHADAGYLEAAQADTKVLLHLESDSQDFANETILFASVLGDRSTWALGASDSSKLRLTNLWERAVAAAYSFLVLRQDMKNDACGEACNVSCSLDSKDDAIV